MKTLKFILPFAPFANQETRATKSGLMYTPKEKKDYMKKIAEFMEPWSGYFEGVKCIKAKFILVCDRPDIHPSHIPSGLWKKLSMTYYKASRPDADNFLKPLQDSMSNHIIQTKKGKNGNRIITHRGAGIIDDDSCLIDIRVIKLYRRMDQEPHIAIYLKELPNNYEPTNTIKGSTKSPDFKLE